MSTSRRAALALSCLAALHASIASAQFDPAVHGFSFQNYTNAGDPVNLTGAELHRMFGDAVCAGGSGPSCRLTPQAAQWAEQISNAMGGGHCEGMAVLSLRFFLGAQQASDFGADTPYGLSLEGNTDLQREIGYWWALQAVPPVSTTRVAGDGFDILDQLEPSLWGEVEESYTVAFFKRNMSGGHAVTPYDVVEYDDGTLAILVYDNNFPGEEREILIDPMTGAWTYVAAANPDDVASRYEGDASSNTLMLIPMSVREGALQCPFCGSYRAGASGRRTVSVTGDATLLLMDETGARLGHLPDGSFVDEIEGADFVAPTSDDLWRDQSEPQYLVSSSAPIEIAIGDAGYGGGDSDLGVLGPGYYLGVENLLLDPGQLDLATLLPDRAGLVYETEGMETPDIVLAAETDAADWLAIVRSRGDSGGQVIAAEIDFADGGSLTLAFDGADAESEMDLYLTRIDGDSVLEFGHENIVVPNGAELTVFFADFDEDGEGLSIDVDMDRDGSADMSIPISDEGGAGPGPGPGGSDDGGGCAVGSGSSGSAPALLGFALVALALSRRRRAR